MINTLKNWFYYFVGIGFLILSNLKYRILGYTPKPFTLQEAQRCSEYNINVVDRWLKHFHEYTGESINGILKNKRILELGPGSDLGVGLYILSKSAKEYNAIDIYNLIESAPEKFYQVFFSNLQQLNIDCLPLIEELDKKNAGNSERLNYFCCTNFDIVSALGLKKIDIFFSNDAFEHFDDINKTIEDISAVAASKAKFIVSVDLQTHSRWIRQHDPNNIYRYPEWLYKLLIMRSSPNRVRPYVYQEALERNGWKEIKIIAESILNEDKFTFVKKHLNKQYIEEKNQMNYLSIFICATKS